MKILFISDIHGIKTNLKYIESILNDFDKLVILGDLYYIGFNKVDKEEVDLVYVKEFLMRNKSKIICMRGNCDSDVDIKTTDIPINDKLSLIHTDGLDIYLTHGNEYNMYNSNKFSNAVLVYGHEHYPYIKQVGDMTYINTGSISLPRNNSKPSYLVYENRKFTLYNVPNEPISEITV